MHVRRQKLSRCALGHSAVWFQTLGLSVALYCGASLLDKAEDDHVRSVTPTGWRWTSMVQGRAEQTIIGRGLPAAVGVAVLGKCWLQLMTIGGEAIGWTPAHRLHRLDRNYEAVRWPGGRADGGKG